MGEKEIEIENFGLNKLSFIEKKKSVANVEKFFGLEEQRAFESKSKVFSEEVILPKKVLEFFGSERLGRREGKRKAINRKAKTVFKAIRILMEIWVSLLPGKREEAEKKEKEKEIERFFQHEK